MSDYNIYKNSFELLYSFKWEKNLHYLDRYVKFISSRANVRIKTETAKHHILPKCMGGENDKDNLVYLTHREHFIAHYMLAKAFPNHTIVHALARMTTTKTIKDSKIYSHGMKLYAQLRSKAFKGCKLCVGRKLSDKTRKLISLRNQEYNKLHPNARKHGPLSKERKEKLRLSILGENNGQSKLKTEQVIEIVKKFFIDKISQSKLGIFYNVSRSTIKQIILGISWKEITHFKRVHCSSENYDLAIKLIQS